MKRELLICESCGHSSYSDEIIRSCGNCFACIGCEIYICPFCDKEIIIKPLKKQT